jgi:hypothetical protein
MTTNTVNTALKTIINFLKRLFNKNDLRERCVKVYGEDFGKIYDLMGVGVPVGNLTETMIILEMINQLRDTEP